MWILNVSSFFRYSVTLFLLIIFCMYIYCLKIKSVSTVLPASVIKNSSSYISSSLITEQVTRALKYNLMEEVYGVEWNLTTKHYISSYDCTTEFVNVQRLPQDHPCVIHLIQQAYLRKPANRSLPYNLNKPSQIDPSAGQSQAILRLLRNQTNGFFLECGALDGEFLSNTLYMERSLNWGGILIEADQRAFSQLFARNRKAYSLPVCLSTKTYPMEVVFNASDWSGSYIVEENSSKVRFSEEEGNKSKQSSYQDIYKVQCFPLYSILLSVGQTDIDFLELDVEGSEYKILETIPWHKVNIKTLSVEWNHIPEGEAAMTQLMKKNKFVKFGHVELAYSREVIYVQDFLDDFRQFEFD